MAFGAVLSTEFGAALSTECDALVRFIILLATAITEQCPSHPPIQHVTMTQKIRIELFRLEISDPGFTHAYLRKWLKQTHNLSISQSRISKTLKRSSEILGPNSESNMGSKRVKSVKYPMIEDA
jgi:hypothetical protein